MFDNEQPQAAPTPVPATPATPPSQGEPEDIFAGTEATTPATPARSATTPGMAAPTGTSTPSLGVTSNNQSPAATSGGSSRTLKIGIAVIVALVVVLIGMLVWAYMTSNSLSLPFNLFGGQGAAPAITNDVPFDTTMGGADDTAPVDTTMPNDGDVGGNDTNSGDAMIDQTNGSDNVLEEVLDSDSDGLTDAEERQLGTDPTSVDSDNDGLFDREEVRVYQTNPLNPDTDGDSYTDGEEVRNGFNPNGDGKLFELP